MVTINDSAGVVLGDDLLRLVHPEGVAEALHGSYDSQ
jgi:hypothetical protein